MMRLLAVLPLAALCVAAGGTPARADDAVPSAPVWVPHESFGRWSLVDGLMRERSDLRLTVALTPAMATPIAKAALKPWIEEGRIELAARLNGDPVLPLVLGHPDAPRPEDALERVAEARELLKAVFSTAPAGFVPGAGAVSTDLLPGLGASGASWILTGAYAAGGAPWVAQGKAAFVPAEPGTDVFGPGAQVFIDGPAGAFLENAAKASRPAGGFKTVGELLRSQGAPAKAEGAAWTAWDAAAVAVPEEANARAAYDAYGQAAAAVAAYTNSGSADLGTLDKAVASLRDAQAARFYRLAPDAAPGLPAELRKALRAVYKRLKQPAPRDLFEGIPDDESGKDRPTGVRLTSGAGFLAFDNPSDSLAATPAPGADAEPWRLLGLSARWNEGALDFTLKVSRAEPGTTPRPVYEIYIDLNGIPGAGALRPLEPRGVFFPARDSWEYALVLAGSDAKLYRHNPRADPEPVATYRAAADEAKDQWTVTVPRSALRGDPRRWGFTVLAYAEDTARPGQTPPAAMVAHDGGIVMGLIAPLDVQKNVVEKRAPNVRVPALRRE